MTLRLALVLLSMSTAYAIASDTPPPSPRGSWTGTYASPESGGELWLQIDSASSRWTARLKVTSPYVEKPEFRECSDVRVDGESISFTVNWGGAVHWKGTMRGTTASGTVSTDHWSGSWKAMRDTTGRND